MLNNWLILAKNHDSVNGPLEKTADLKEKHSSGVLVSSMADEFAHLPDATLVLRALEQKQAFAFLMRRYEGPLDRYLRRLGVSRLEDREDLLQTIFLKMYRALNDVDPTLKFSSWAYRIARNEAVSFFRAKSIRPEDIVDELDHPAFEQLLSKTDIVQELDRSRSAEEVRHAMNMLDQKYRDVLILRYFEELDYQEISDVLKVPEGTVATLIHRAKTKLRDAFAKKSPRLRFSL